jgi:hypothetical protein
VCHCRIFRAKRWIVAADPDEAVAKVGEYVSYGLNHLVFHAPGHDQPRFLELSRRIWDPDCANWADSRVPRNTLRRDTTKKGGSR